MDEEELEIWYDEKKEIIEKKYTSKINLLRDPFPEEELLKKKERLKKKYKKNTEEIINILKEEFEKDSIKLREQYQKKYDKIYNRQQNKRQKTKKQKERQKKFAPLTKPAKATASAILHFLIFILKKMALMWKNHKEKSAKNAVIIHFKLKKIYDFTIHPKIKPIEYPTKNLLRKTITHPVNREWEKIKEKNKQKYLELKKIIIKITEIIIEKAKKIIGKIQVKLKKIQEIQEKYSKKFSEFKEKRIQPILDKLPKLKKKEEE